MYLLHGDDLSYEFSLATETGLKKAELSRAGWFHPSAKAGDRLIRGTQEIVITEEDIAKGYVAVGYYQWASCMVPHVIFLIQRLEYRARNANYPSESFWRNA